MIGFILRYRGAVPRAMRKEFRTVLKSAYHSVGTLWHARMRPKHFTPAGAQEYRYTRRWGEYTRRKERQHGHRNPLMFTGQSRLFTRLRDVRATSKGVRVVMRAGNLLLRPPDSDIDKADELTRISRADEREMARAFQKSIDRGFNAIQFSQRVDTRRA